MTMSDEYWFSEKSVGLIVFGVLFVVFGLAVYGFVNMIDTTQPEADKIWIAKAVSYIVMAFGALAIFFRYRGLLDGKRRLYIREWGFLLMFRHLHIPFDDFSYVLIERLRRGMRAWYQVSLARKQDKIRKFDRTDIGDEADRKVAEVYEQNNMVGIATAAFSGISSSHQSGGYVLYGLYGFSDLNVCREEAEEIAQLVGVPIHERVADNGTNDV